MPANDEANLPVADLVQPVAETSAPTDSNFEALKAKFELIQADSLKKGETNAKLHERVIAAENRLKEFEGQQATARKTELADQGQWEALWRESEARNKILEDENNSLKGQLEQQVSEFNVERLRRTALSLIASANALNPEHVLTLLEAKAQLREIEGHPTVFCGGAALPLDDYLQSLKQPSSGWAQYFSASGAKGMNAAPSASTVPGMSNPYKGSTKNLTAALRLEKENPELAAVLKAEALR